jgi:hypothetical protein
MMFMALVWLIALAMLARWVLQPPVDNRLSPGQVERLESEVRQLRDELERMTGQMDRLVEEQSFLLRLMERRDPPRLERGDDPAEPPER